MKKSGFKGEGNTLSSMTGPGAKSLQVPKSPRPASDGFKGMGGGPKTWPGKKDSRPC